MSQPAADSVVASDETSPTRDRIADRIGVGASVLCAVHCAATPFLLLLLPAFGQAWSHPATHWGMALLVVPLAGFMMRSSYRKHGRKWIVAAGSLGIVFILSGAAAPYLEASPVVPAAAASETEGEGGSTEGESGSAAAPCCEHCCKDSCCPTVQETEDGSWMIHIPTASILTTLGGAFLIMTHVGNLRLCHCATCQPSE